MRPVHIISVAVHLLLSLLRAKYTLKGKGPVAEHPIQGLMQTAMESIKEMVDVNTIVGDAVETPAGSVIIPVSRVSFGFASGGGDYRGVGKNSWG